MVHLPIGIQGWTVFVLGLLLIGFRIHGIFSPRTWIELTERQFAYDKRLKLIGSCLVIVTASLLYFNHTPGSFVSLLYLVGLAFLLILGIMLILVQNNLRLMFIATAESDDKMIRYVSIGTTSIGLLVALAPWFMA